MATTTATALPNSHPPQDESYILRPNFKQKYVHTYSTTRLSQVNFFIYYFCLIQNYRFRPALVNKWMTQILQDRLKNATYHPDTCSQWTREIADEIKSKLKGCSLSPSIFRII